MKLLRADMTGWTSPGNCAVDFERKLIFAIDTTMAQRDDRNLPDPDWSRVAVFDFDGKYVNDINRYNALAKDAKENDERRTWYNDIAIDPARQRVYLTARRSNELLAFGYDGKPVNKIKPEVGAGSLAVFADGRIAVGNGWRVEIYDPDLKKIATCETPDTEYKNYSEGIRGLATDNAGRLYATTGDATIAYIRWAADLKTAEAIGGPNYLRMIVDFPKSSVVAGRPLLMKTTVKGRPQPQNPDKWQVMIRPSDGSDRTWRQMPTSWRDGVLGVVVPAGFRGIYDLMVVFGNDVFPLGDRKDVPCVQATIAVMPEGAQRSVAAITANGRRAFVQGEAIPIQVVRRDAPPAADANAKPRQVSVKLALLREHMVPTWLTPNQQGEVEGPPERASTQLASDSVILGKLAAVEIPGDLTARLAPGDYTIKVEAADHECYSLPIQIAASQPDSPMQRINYHEMGDSSGANEAHWLPDLVERETHARDYARSMAALHVTRETNRVMGTSSWRRDAAAAEIADPGYAPAEYYAIPNNGGWGIENYFDIATAYGIKIDSMILGHCSGVRFRDFWLKQLNPRLQQDAFWRSRFPSFYGFLYNDEMFFGQWVTDWTPTDVEWLKKTSEEKFKNSKNPMADTYRLALRTMYDSFNGAVMKSNPAARRLATPMWQFPAVEGSYPPEIYKNMSESFSHYISEGYHIPWYAPHSAENLRRPGLPVRGVVDWGVNGDLGYAKNTMQILGRGVQGIGYQGADPWEHGRAVDGIRVTNLIGKIYGPIFAEVPPANEGAVLYSYQQDVTEKRNGIGTPSFERVWGLYGAGLMCGVPLSIICEEDVAAGWLLSKPAAVEFIPGDKPRVPMLFLVGQKEKLPDDVNKAIAAYMAAGGKAFVDADSADYPGATRMDVKTYETARIHGETYAADSAWPAFQPGIEKLASEFGRAVGPQRRFPMDTDDPWVAKNHFDGGAIQYMMLATEVSPYPWDAGTGWSMMNACYNGVWLPKIVTLSFPASKGVVYDVFDKQIVEPKVDGKTAKLTVDLTTWPGKLYAIAPAEIGAPEISTAVEAGTLHYKIGAADKRGKAMAARVPLRIRLLGNDREVMQEIYRGTGADGTYAGSLPLPVNAARQWFVEATELVSGKGSVATVAKAPDVASTQALGKAFAARPDVEIQRDDRVLDLLADAKKGGIVLVTANDKILTAEQTGKLATALKQRGVEMRVGPLPPKEVTPGVYLAAGFMQGGGASLGDMLRPARNLNLLLYPLTESTVPGPGRGIVSPLYAPRGWEENCVALVGGDADGLAKTVDAFAAFVGADGVRPPDGVRPAPSARMAAPKYKETGKAAEVPPVPRLTDMTGARLTGITISPDRKHLLVTAEGFLRNVALVADDGKQGKVVRAERVGQAKTTGSPWMSRDGSMFGASARVAADFGEGFHLCSVDTGLKNVFASFGNMPPQVHQFGVNDDASIIVVGGTYGLVCWKRDGNGWKEAWSNEYWKGFDKLDWPVANDAERVPSFNAVIPPGADYALIVFCEFSQNGWVTPENFCTAYVAAVNLADGKERWRFDVPIPKTQVWPKLVLSPNGSRLLLQVQMGGWNRETFRFFALKDGKAAASWDAPTAPASIAVADATGRIAETYGRLFEVRSPEGKLIYNVQWPSRPLSLAFAADGQTLFMSDDADSIACFDATGKQLWRRQIGCVTELAAAGDAVYAAGWDGRLRCIAADGTARWTLDLTPAMKDQRAMGVLAESARYPEGAVIQAKRQPNVSPTVPDGPNMLTAGKATLKLGGTGGWMSDGKVQIKPEDLTNGKLDDVDTPWLHLDEVFWDAGAGRQVFAEIEFKEPTDIKALTVYENPRHKESWPTQGLVQVWDENLKQYNTVIMGVFLGGPVNTYPVNLKATKIRYVPWNNYYRNFYTSEIEVR